MLEYNCEMFQERLFPAFGNRVKNSVRQNQKDKCAMCGEVVPELEIHHRVPENALRRGRDGIRGNNGIANAVGLCHGENGGGEGGEDDCHEIADQVAIHKRLFFLDGEFVPLSQVPDASYRHYWKPEKIKKHHKRQH